MHDFKDADDVYRWLNLYLNFERKTDAKEYRLDRMRKLHHDFAYPDRAYRVIHIAGSKGKGSTSAMLESILRAGGLKTGLFTSPHFISFTERIAIDGIPVANDILLPAAKKLAEYMDGKKPEDFPGEENPTYFELLTILGFLCFRDAGIDIAIVEVGLGGRLDSTNVVEPELTAITGIELEHTDILGKTIAAIAAEKAGIIKEGVPVFTAAWKEDALEVIKATAKNSSAKLVTLDEVLKIEELRVDRSGSRFLAKTADAPPLRLQIAMHGEHQARNASLALIIARYLGFDDEVIRAALANVRLRARFEIMDRGSGIVLDGAHTTDSIEAAVKDFSLLFPGKGLLLFGCAADKNAASMAAILRQDFDSVIITKPGDFKESDLKKMEAAFLDEGFTVKCLENTEMAVREAVREALEKKLPLLVTGSFYLCAIFSELIEGGPEGSGQGR